MKRTCVAPVLADLALDRHDVCQHVAMTDHDAFRLRRRAGRKNHLRDVVPCDRDVWPRSVRSPVKLVEWPACRTVEGRGGSVWWQIVADEHDPRVHQTDHLGNKLRRRPVVDRYSDDPCQDAAPVGSHPLGAVLGPENDMIAFEQTCVLQACSEAACGTRHGFVRMVVAFVAVVEHEERVAAHAHVAKKIYQRVSPHVMT